MKRLSLRSQLPPGSMQRTAHGSRTHNSLLTTVYSFALFLAVSSNAPAADSTVNYDTAWTYVYDGGKDISLTPSIPDMFFDVKVFSDGSNILAGASRMPDSAAGGNTDRFLTKLDANGKLLWKRIFRNRNFGGGVHSVVAAKNGDLVIGGIKASGPWIARTDSTGNIKWETWLYDSIAHSATVLSRGATINCLRETKRGTIICAAGDYFTDQNYTFGNSKYNYTAFLEFDSTGKIVHWGQWDNLAGFSLGGFFIEETGTGYYLASGNQALVYMDTTAHLVWEKKYTFMLNGVGSEVNNITRCKMLRDGSLMVAGQAYEGNCWTKFNQLFYDAWWSPISYAYGTNTTWDTAGFQGGDDIIYDFTQLNNGNLVFVGSRYSGPGGIWTFVTDSTGKNLLWEKQTPVPYKTDLGTSARAYSVCATPDSGFTVAGELILSDDMGGHNAMAAHFVPISSGVVNVNQSYVSFPQLAVRLVANRLVVTSGMLNMPATISLYNVSGKRIAMQTGQKGISFDISNVARGVYFVTIRTEKGKWTSRVVVR
jgi:hypothetical protein